ncbi:MAG: FixH family protein [Perlucidibaca sp.]
MTVAYERPWYKHPWVWFIIAIPTVAVVFSLQFVYIAVTHPDPVVRDDWYEDGKAINQDFARSDAAARLGLRADVRLDSETGEVLLTLHASKPVNDERINLHFLHATLKDRDQSLVLHHLVGQEYRGQLLRPLEGDFQIELSTPDWRIAANRHLPDGDGFSLTAE